ncbi:MAG: D-alanyl-D-alanine carboxypeptidase family protein, partial [Clostridiales Family XIII bacterium]|nr:D-alanyl-D-alanine carboxypeptidase family protein [Clostridiales Family XIII bacterium]
MFASRFLGLWYAAIAIDLLFKARTLLMNEPGDPFEAVNLVPFKTIAEYIYEGDHIQIMGNFLILFPLPALLHFNFPKMGLRALSTAAFCTAILLEPLQLLVNIITGTAANVIDIDDFLLNASGCFLGLQVARLLLSKKSRAVVYIAGIFSAMCISIFFYTGNIGLNHGMDRIPVAEELPVDGQSRAAAILPAGDTTMGAPSAGEPGKLSKENPPAGSQASEILLVNTANPLPSDYRPDNLVALYGQQGRHFQLMEADIKICEIVFESMDAMFAAAQEDGVGGFIITSGYRTRDEQMSIWNSTTDGTAAKPGESEHETGLAFDVAAAGNKNFALTPQFEWLSAHCAEYGFIIRYPQGKEDVTGYPY